MKIIRINKQNREQFQQGLAALEKRATYPLGDDFFQIDHGEDYFRFFERLGEMVYYGVVNSAGEVIGAAAGMLRTIPFVQGQAPKRTFYICDLKIDPRYRGKNASLQLASHGFFRNYWRCPRGYAITMNDPAQKTNRIVHLARKFRWASINTAGPLFLYSLDDDQMREVAPLIKAHRGGISYRTLHGIKDIVLESSQKPMALAHVQFGPCAEPGELEPILGHVHMFCSPAADAMTEELTRLGLVPSASATIVHHRMGQCDWRFILTSDI